MMCSGVLWSISVGRIRSMRWGKLRRIRHAGATETRRPACRQSLCCRIRLKRTSRGRFFLWSSRSIVEEVRFLCLGQQWTAMSPGP
ncbi:hypothetical protein AUEXF2481DRAFT_299955 [Aureobasidium subglaciale EXF-2481]|uniref:Uncharacterized protein n=1 Tax=Aureobasidium subglaciale (strain EXF-2481) TaxID=1043005 RepID=A0A074Z415_AURSE|nr:uncharacterized protein AUEXF2481DRAFT_299955 [Aureobasidium subglaciale EXF-2481]KEQ93746.1 hypothetical protein AUEXF2481DRAFT_299955 [Aureobasidium subglaciale EXF-2481]